MLPEICVGFVILGVTAYAVLGSADFGAGFWDLTAGGAQRGGRVRGMIQRSMGPVWEANHVWLIFVLVIVVWTERYGAARFMAVAAVAAITVGWALAQDPYLLPPGLTLEEAAASDATLAALVVSVGLGMLLLAPSLWFLYRLVLQGRLDQEYEPLDQRFRPLSAGDEPRQRP
jgi:cytochrome bd-type quinol oxidase subunit 2